ncbi:uncharacterized protein V6R79_019645 [Siganus canaliculatus]
MTVKWKHNGSTAAEWYGKKVFFRKQFEGRCELNTRTGELTINHLTLSHSGSYSVDINGKENNTVQLQVTSKKTAAGEAGDEEEPGETTELLSQSGGVQQESRGGGVQQESRGGGDQQKSTDDVNDPPDVSSAVTSSSEGTVYEEVNGTAVLHPASGLTGKMTRIRWTYNDKTVAEWSGGNISFSNQFKGRCELNTRTGELTIKHLTLSDSGFYSAEVNNKETNRVQLQVKKGTVCEVDGTAVLHPGSALTGNITKIIWKYNGSEAASWAEKMPHYYGQFEVRCALNTRTGELTINHLKLSDSGSYSVEINNKETNRVQLQVMNKSSV